MNAVNSRYEKGHKKDDGVHDTKAEYRKQFIDINFYGMQSKVQNPMNKVEWKDGAHKRAQVEAAGKKPADKVNTAIREMVQRPTYLSPDERAKNKKSLLKNFKSNIMSLENSLDKLDNLKHGEVIKNSFGVGESP